MQYRYFTNGHGQETVQRKTWWGWQWLDTTNAWCNWYGERHPFVFDTLDEAKKSMYQLEK